MDCQAEAPAPPSSESPRRAAASPASSLYGQGTNSPSLPNQLNASAFHRSAENFTDRVSELAQEVAAAKSVYSDEDIGDVQSKLATFELDKIQVQRSRSVVIQQPDTFSIGSRAETDTKQLFTSEPATTLSSGATKSVPSFQRVLIVGGTDETADSIEDAEACQALLRAVELRRLYHEDCKPAPYYGSFDADKYEAVHLEAELEHQRFWGAGFRGRAAAPFDASLPEQPSPLVRKCAPLMDCKWGIGSDGVFRVSTSGADPADVQNEIPSVDQFFHDLEDLLRIIRTPATNTMCFKRLELLDARFNLHRLLNARLESAEQRRVPHRDFYNVRKVDTHIHHSAVMTQKHLLRFMKHKMKRCADEIVLERNGKFLTVKEVFDSLGLSAYDLSIDYLDTHADNTFHRFDRFNLKYNPIGESRLREVFLKPSNLIGGRYLAEITQQVFKDLEENKFVLIEPRLSVYGRSRSEWGDLGRWYTQNKLYSPNVRWMIQLPRLFRSIKQTNPSATFQTLLDNIFEPLFAATARPDLHPELDCFLDQVVGMDCVDDESIPDEPVQQILVPATERESEGKPTLGAGKGGSWGATFRLPKPSEWTSDRDPPYAYWIYYIWANLRVLNAWRARLKKTTFSFRPHAGEAGDVSHLAATFMCAESINHGILLRKSPSLQYLYYLEQIGLSLSPLSNNRLFVEYHSSPFPTFFARGLRVTLSTDDPLLLHVTKDALVEEYSVAAQVWKLSTTDSCEIARNSVIISGLEHPMKAHYLGERYYRSGVEGNDISCTNVSDIRIQYRDETLKGERAFVWSRGRSQASTTA